MFTEYKFDPEIIKALVAEKAANLKANRGFSDLLGFGLSVIIQRLKKDPRRYLDYGPYWPALKDVLRRAGYDFGSESVPMVAAEYKGSADVETLIMADEFRSMNLAKSMLYTNQFMLDGEDGQAWTLFDADMEALAPAP